MKRNLQIKNMSWRTVTEGIKDAFEKSGHEITESQGSWISRSLQDVYKKCLLLINDNADTKISNANFAGAVFISMMRGEYEDITTAVRDVGNDRIPAKLGTCNDQVKGIIREIQYYNKTCKKKLDLTDEYLQCYADVLLKLEKNKNSENDNQDDLKNKKTRYERKLNEIKDSTAKDFKLLILEMNRLDKEYKKAEIKEERSWIHDELSNCKLNVRILCCKIKALVCKNMIQQLWIKQIVDSLDHLKDVIGDNVINGKFYIAKDKDNPYSIFEPKSQITVEVKIKKRYIRQ